MKHKVLVVDDHPATVDLIKSALEGWQIEVRTATNGAECLLAASRSRPSLIIMDVAMPVMDGFQTLEVLRHSPEGSSIPVIMLTARASDTDVMNGWRLGVTSYVTKPFPISELVLLVTRVLEGEPGTVGGDQAEESVTTSPSEPRSRLGTRLP